MVMKDIHTYSNIVIELAILSQMSSTKTSQIVETWDRIKRQKNEES